MSMKIKSILYTYVIEVKYGHRIVDYDVIMSVSISKMWLVQSGKSQEIKLSFPF